jgi:hypothetical protein
MPRRGIGPSVGSSPSPASPERDALRRRALQHLDRRSQDQHRALAAQGGNLRSSVTNPDHYQRGADRLGQTRNAQRLDQQRRYEHIMRQFGMSSEHQAREAARRARTRREDAARRPARYWDRY